MKTCSIPQSKINGGSINHHICTEIIENGRHIILYVKIKQKKTRTWDVLKKMKIIYYNKKLDITVGKVLLV